MHARPRFHVALLGALLAGLAAEPAVAVDAVLRQSWDTKVVDATLAPDGAITATNFSGQASGMAGNPSLDGSAWAHSGLWWSLELPDGQDVTISVTSHDAAELAPGFAVWAVGAAEPFDGGTQSFAGETSTAGFGTPHSFNAFGPIGDDGTLWMQDGEGGNVQELLGTAITGPSVDGVGGWGETIETGVQDMRVGTAFAQGVTGSTTSGNATVTLEQVTGGWVVIYVSGTDHALAGGLFDMQVTAVPEPGVLGAQLAAVAALCAVRRQRRRAPRR